jgi:hypothetical protein
MTTRNDTPAIVLPENTATQLYRSQHRGEGRQHCPVGSSYGSRRQPADESAHSVALVRDCVERYESCADLLVPPVEQFRTSAASVDVISSVPAGARRAEPILLETLGQTLERLVRLHDYYPIPQWS